MPASRSAPRCGGVAFAAIGAAMLVAACGSSDGPAVSGEVSTSDRSAFATEAPAVLPDGFDRGLAIITKADGTICEICVWRATSGDQRSRGLMGVTDLGPADGMTFEYDELRDGWFWMKNTVLPLSIAFFGADGALVDSFDMEPCTADPCQRYEPDGRYDLAIEVPQGELGDLGLTVGSTLELTGDPCPVP